MLQRVHLVTPPTIGRTTGRAGGPATGEALDLDLWMRRYGAGLRRYFARRVAPADAEDLLQDVFQRLQGARVGSAIEDPERYTFTVARSVLVTHYRRRTARHAAAHDPIDDDRIAIDEISPERIAIGRQEYQRAIAAIAGLPPRARAAFQFHRFENMTYEAIAQRMGITRDSVKELISRALVGIARAMEYER